ncbi:MAG TPA: clostripain-related cysteine peptidase, partial [Caldilineaceae bacterium]|nr:clostripain-related cysteine peptidase [Caldilineaceae bacterium]
QYDATTRRLTHTTAIDPTAPRHYQYQVTVDTTNEPSTILDLPTVVTGSDTNGLATTVANAGATLYIPNTALIKTLMLIYAVGDNDLGEGMIQLLNRAERATGGDPTVAVALLMDGPGAQDAYLYYLQPDTGQLNCPNYQNITCDGRYQFGVNLFTWRENTADVDSLATFIATAQRTYPTAQTIALSLVGHGSGWSPTLLAGQPHGIADQPHGIADQPSAGLLWDQSMIGDNTLSTGELRQALEQAQQATGQSVDLLYLDACSMAMAEVAYELSGTADYLLASQSISWAAFPYDQLILAIQEGMSGQEIGEAWLAIEADGLTAHSGVYPYTFSLVDLAQMPAVALAHQTLVSTLRAAWQSDTTRTVATAFADAVEATACVESNYDGKINRFDTYCDLGSFAQRIEGAFVDYPDIANAANAIGTALSSAIITTANHSGHPWSPPESEWWNFTAPPLNGLSLYMPLAPHVDDVRRRYYTANQLGYLTVTDWDTLLADAWGGSEPPTTTVDCDCPANVKLLPLQPSIRLQSPMVTVQEQEAFTVTVELLDLPQQRALGGAQLWLTYDANLVEGIDCTTVAPAGIQLAQCHLDAPGLIRLAFTAPDGFIQDFTAAQLHMRAIGPAGAVSTIRLIVDKLVDAQGAPLSVHTGDSLITIGAGAAQLAGDVNCSGGRDVQDAVLILRYSVSELAAGTQCPPAAGTIYAPACDVDGDGGCQINDALFIVQCAVGIDNGLCPASLQSASATTPRAINEQRRSAPPIQLIPSAIDDEGYIIFSLQTAREETKLGALGITLRYDADQLELHECLQDPQTQFSYAACHPHDSSAVQTADNTGVVNVGLLAPEGVDGALQLATLRFRLRNPAFDNPVQFLAIENATVFDSRGTMLPNPQEEAQQIYLPVIVR